MSKKVAEKLEFLVKKLELAKRNNNRPAINRLDAQIEILEEITGESAPEVEIVPDKSVKKSVVTSPQTPKDSDIGALTDLTVAELGDAVNKINDVDALEALLSQETRKTGKQAIKDRIEELK